MCPSHMGYQAAAITSGAMQQEGGGDTSSVINCPCAAHPRTENLTPDYVEDHYYCDTATYNTPKEEWYANNTLWDSKDCYPGSKYCENDRLPWFWRTLPQETSDDVEVVVCFFLFCGHRI